MSCPSAVSSAYDVKMIGEPSVPTADNVPPFTRKPVPDCAFTTTPGSIVSNEFELFRNTVPVTT